MDSKTLDDFHAYLSQLRCFNEPAIQGFVTTYESYIRRSLRMQIASAGLQSAADSADLCQSVLAAVLFGLAAGDFEIKSEEDLRRLVCSIANKKFLNLNRHETAAKRDHRNTYSLEQVADVAESNGHGSSDVIDYSGLIDKVVALLSDDERKLFAWRREGVAWNTISERLGDEATMLRKRLSRALHRVSVELKIADE